MMEREGSRIKCSDGLAGDRGPAYESTAVRLMRLLDDRLPEIVRGERKNEERVYLYGIGEHWAAFEHSAYLLYRFFPAADMSVVTHPEEPFPAVMICISDEELRAFAERHIFTRDLPDYKEVFVSRIVPAQYRVWHRTAVRTLQPDPETM